MIFFKNIFAFLLGDSDLPARLARSGGRQHDVINKKQERHSDEYGNFNIPIILLFVISLLISSTSIAQQQSSEPPIIPVGEESYLQWERLPYHRIGVRAFMASTYDRRGSNFRADAGNFLYQEHDSFNVTMDVQGNGILYFVRTNHHHGSPWIYETDGSVLVVKETATDNPVGANKKFNHTEFIPQNLFPYPFTWTWTTTRGADLMWRPIPFSNSFRLAYSRTFYGTGYYIYHLFSPQHKYLSQPIATWDRQPPQQEVLELINRSGTDIAPTGKGVSSYRGKIKINSYQHVMVKNISESPAMIRAIRFKVPREQAYDFGQCRLRVTWDNRWHASIDAPIDLFFGAGRLHNDNGREYLVKGLPSFIRYDDKFVYLECFWPMPFFKNALIEITEQQGKNFSGIEYEIRTVPYTDPLNHAAYFHATYSNHPHPKEGRDNIFLDTYNTEGGGDWSGHFVGMSWIFSHNGTLHTLEGDPRFYFDNARTPQAHGTGTEEWGGGGDYWGGNNMTIPFAGYPLGKQLKDTISKKDLINSAYRFLIADYFPFGNRAVICLEHGGDNNSFEHYAGVVYWYGVNDASLVLTDEVNVCDSNSIRIHNYQSSTAEKPYLLSSLYDKTGPDTNLDLWLGKCSNCSTKLFHAPETDYVRIMKGVSIFTVDINPNNLGVMMRRKFDYMYPNQQAKIYVRDAETQSGWDYAGTMYSSGSNTFLHSRPEGKNFSENELAKSEPRVFTSNRRWSEDEFLFPAGLTQGISKLEIKIEYVKVNRELFPGKPYPAESCWSESRYWMYCYKLPHNQLK